MRLHALTFVATLFATLMAAEAPSLADTGCPPDARYVGQWVETVGDTDITHMQCVQLSDAEIKKLASEMYPEHYSGLKPPIVPRDFIPQPYGEASPHHWYWAHAPASGSLSLSAMRDLVRGGGGGAEPGVPLPGSPPTPTKSAKHKKH